jgi:hypothetical protein
LENSFEKNVTNDTPIGVKYNSNIKPKEMAVKINTGRNDILFKN